MRGASQGTNAHVRGNARFIPVVAYDVPASA
jgi:hypothetical protein